MTTEAQPFESGQALPIGAIIGQFRILSVLGAGGFGITYIAEDTVILRQVVIKENFPKFCSYRDRRNHTVMPLSTKHAASLEKSLIDFEKEAKMLASLPHRNIVPVYSIFQAHGTVFFVMPLILGPTLSKYVLETREQKRPSLDELTLRRHLALILQCLDFIHSHNVWHRDIKPDNLIISSETGEPVLIDFGAARQTMTDVTQSMTLIGTYGFGAPEQLIGKKVGAYSDIYALGATMYSLITGEIPERGDLRLFQDSLVPLTKISSLTTLYSSDFLASIDRAMKPRVEFRTSSAQDWLDELSGKKPISKTIFKRTGLRGIAVSVPISAPNQPALIQI